MHIETISYVKKNAAALELDEPIVVTQNGVPAYVIESWEAQQEREQSIALLKLMTLSGQDKAEGLVMSKEELLAGITRQAYFRSAMEGQCMKFQYTRTVSTCINDIANCLIRVGVALQPVLSHLLTRFEENVSTFPKGCQVCPELLKPGCVRYRQFNSDDGYRVLHSVDGEGVTVHAILAQRQDIKQLLFKRLSQP